MDGVFTKIFDIDCPASLHCEADSESAPEFTVRFAADGTIPFPQLILWDAGNQIHLLKGAAIRQKAPGRFEATVPKGTLKPGPCRIQIEGCRRADIERAGGSDWIKAFVDLRVERDLASRARVLSSDSVRLYFGIHKHMHQPYYDAVFTDHWDGEKDEIFGSRQGPYTHYLAAAARQYIDGGLAHAGLSTSFSGSLIEQLDRCDHEARCGGVFKNWSETLSGMAMEQTALGHPRIAFTAFGDSHPLMALIPERDIIRSIEWHRETVRQHFGVEPTRVLFPPETAFHVRMIPALKRAGIKAVIYDSIHRFRACREYPYAGPEEGMLPPNRAEQVNPAVSDWMQLQNIWAGSLISPQLLRPEMLKYEDPDGHISTIVGIPAERYIGNEDARGGFGALLYPSVLGQVYDRIVSDGSFDPKHPPFFILHSDGDNYGGGADSYYKHNTGNLVKWLQEDPRFVLTGIEDYLELFPPDESRAIHIEPGSWSGADNGDPQFRKWFSRHEQSYSPDLNSWAVLTALQNLVHSLEDAGLGADVAAEMVRLMLRAETSCYWYWTGQDKWDQQVTNAANRAYELAGSARTLIPTRDLTGPTIFAPWITPENPGGKIWGQGGLVDAPRVGTVHTLVYDVSGLKSVELIVRAGGSERRLPMQDHGPYPTGTGARLVANYLSAALPAGAGDVRYYLEAIDGRGNKSRSSLERVFLQ